MKASSRLAALALVAGLALSGCAVIRDQQSAGAYIDDAAISTSLKAKYVESKTVSAGSVQIETLNGVVQLSGFVKSAAEKAEAERIARETKGVKEVKNNLQVRP